MSSAVEVIIIGAGPYGLSLAAHLRSRGIAAAIFGPPMQVWRYHMPRGMLLKSDGFASNLSDPAAAFTLKHFCQSRGLPYDDTHVPVAIETFVEYALAFQQNLVPHLDPRTVARVDPAGNGFAVQLEDGETITARRVVVAVGISHFAYVPPSLAALPAEFLTHSSAHTDCSRLQGRRVAVIGGGASAIDLAALLHESGAKVTVIARAPEIRFHNPPRPGPRTLWQRLRNPSSGLGPGWKSRFYTDAPWVFRYFPENHRIGIVHRHLGPAPGWPMRKRVEGKVPMLLGHGVTHAQQVNGRVRLSLATHEGRAEDHETDHVIAATGYRPDLSRLRFLAEPVQSQIRTIANAPALSPDFQSSIPGLYFVGIAAANTFGPMMRFAYGANYTAHRLAAHLHKQIEK